MRKHFKSVRHAAVAAFLHPIEHLEARRLLSLPIVTVIERLNPSMPLTDADTLQYRVRFSEPVTGVDAGDFRVATTGSALITGTIQVTPVSPSVYDVVLNGARGEGTIGLNLVDDRSIRNSSGAPLSGYGDGIAFQAGAQYPVAGNPRALTLDDFNRDGHLDLASAGGGAFVDFNNGNGDGTLALPQGYSTPGAVAAIATGDVNHDGRPDLVAAEVDASLVGVFLGNGNGTFTPQVTYANGAKASSVALADLNNDGQLDAVVANYVGSTIGVYSGNGDGTFKPQRTFAANSGSGVNPNFVTVSDVNNDGSLDVLFAATSSNFPAIGILLGNGNGSLKDVAYIATQFPPTGFTVADVNDDGKSDLVISEGSTGVGVFLGNGNGTFKAESRLYVGIAPVGIQAADLNGDGNDDLVVSHPLGGTVGILTGNGDGTFSPERLYNAGIYPGSIAVGDLDGDGRVDLAVANQHNSTATVLLASRGSFTGPLYEIRRAFPHLASITRDPSGTSPNTLGFLATFTTDVLGVDPTDFSVTLRGAAVANPTVQVQQISGSIYSITVTGVSGTGTVGVDLVDDGTIHDVAGNPLTGFIPTGTVFSSATTIAADPRAYALAAADMNQDGKVDLMVTGSADPLYVFIGSGNGQFATPFVNAGDSKSFKSIDMNGDGFQDLVFGGISVQVGLGNGYLGQRSFMSAGSNSPVVAIGDPNMDGRLDIFTQGSTGLVAFVGGGGQFDGPITVIPGISVGAIAIDDVNGDGKPDLIFADLAGHVDVAMGNGDGTFASVQTMLGPSRPYAITTSDLNGDGKPDLLVTGNDSLISVFMGNGNGSFGTRQTFAAGAGPRSLIVCDVDGDGAPDVVVGDYYAGTLSILLGNSAGGFAPGATISTGGHPTSVVIADFNGDGRQDLAVANYGSGTVGVLLNNNFGNRSGEAYSVGDIPLSEQVVTTPSNRSVTLLADSNGTDVDWVVGSSIGRVHRTDVTGLSISGSQSAQTVTLDYSNGSPLPGLLRLDGPFTLKGLQGQNPFSGTTLDVLGSTLWMDYSTESNLIPAVMAALNRGYDGGRWDGSGSGSGGAILSSIAAAGPQGVYGVEFANSADGVVPGVPANTIEIRYTVMGDANLDGAVNSADSIVLARAYLLPGGTWDRGDFNYDGVVNLADASMLQRNYGQAVPAIAAPVVASPIFTTAPPSPSPSIGVTAGTTPSNNPADGFRNTSLIGPDESTRTGRPRNASHRKRH